MVEFDGIDIVAADIKIPGVDALLGSALYDGEMEIYLAVLQAFMESIPAVIDKLRNVSEADLGNYANVVHGFCGSCASIGAEQLRERAFVLEKKSKAGDFSGIPALNYALIKNASTLVSDIEAFLTSLSTR